MTPAPDQGSSIRGMRVAKSEKIQVHFRHTWFAILASCPGLDLNLSTRVTDHNSQRSSHCEKFCLTEISEDRMAQSTTKSRGKIPIEYRLQRSHYKNLLFRSLLAGAGQVTSWWRNLDRGGKLLHIRPQPDSRHLDQSQERSHNTSHNRVPYQTPTHPTGIASIANYC